MKLAMVGILIAIGLGVSIIAFSSRVSEEISGVFSMNTRGVSFEMNLSLDGTFRQEINMPDGEILISNGWWKIITVDGNRYLNAENVYFNGICDYSIDTDFPRERSEINLPIGKYFGVQTRIIACSDGRSLTKRD